MPRSSSGKMLMLVARSEPSGCFTEVTPTNDSLLTLARSDGVLLYTFKELPRCIFTGPVCEFTVSTSPDTLVTAPRTGVIPAGQDWADAGTVATVLKTTMEPTSDRTAVFMASSLRC